MSPDPNALRTAARLLRLYPRAWRERYGAEFTELLTADLAERPRCWRRTADVVRAALVARLAPPGPVAPALAALTTAGVATVGFVAFGSSIWAQLVGGAMVSAPDSHAVVLGSVVLTVTGGYLAVLGVLAFLPLAAAVLRTVRRDRSPVRGPAAAVVAGLAVLVVGGRHFASRWPAAAGHPAGRHHGLLAHVAAYGWADTLGISTYWVHPHRLFTLPAGELGWMWLSPLALLAVLIGGMRVVQRIDLSAAVLRFETRLAVAAVIGLAPALAAAAAWVTASQGDANATFRAGTLDLALLAAMTAAVAAAAVAADRARLTAKRTLR